MALSRTRQKHVFLYKTTIRRTDIGTSKSLSTPKLISMDFFTLGEFKDTNISTTSHTKIPTSDSVPPTSQLSSVHSIHIQTLLQNPPRKSHRESKTTIVFVQSSQTHSSHPFSSQTKTPPFHLPNMPRCILLSTLNLVRLLDTTNETFHNAHCGVCGHQGILGSACARGPRQYDTSSTLLFPNNRFLSRLVIWDSVFLCPAQSDPICTNTNGPSAGCGPVLWDSPDHVTPLPTRRSPSRR